MEFRKMITITLYAKQKKRHRCTEQTFGLWEKVRVGCFGRTASKHVYYQGWNRSPAQVGYMRQVLGPGALGRPRGIRWRGRWERGSGWGIHVNLFQLLWLIFQRKETEAQNINSVHIYVCPGTGLLLLFSPFNLVILSWSEMKKLRN